MTGRQSDGSAARLPDLAIASSIPVFDLVSVPHAVACEQSDDSETVQAAGLRDYTLDYLAARSAIHRLFAEEGFPTDPSRDDLRWLRDPLGKPYVAWYGEVENWAAENARDSRCLHISNTHDGGMHLVLAAYDPCLVGIGIDLVWLPRLRLDGKNRDYLHRFARRFMAPEEQDAFLASADTDDEEALRVRVAAHFSLMEAASKACGTGLKIGVGMGKATSLPKQSLGAMRLSPNVALFVGPEAQSRLDFLGAARYEACWRASEEHLLSVVALFKQQNAQNLHPNENQKG